MMKWLVPALGLVVAILAVVGVSLYFGAFNVAADAPHFGITSKALALVRDRSIELQATDLTVPNLTDPNLIALGAEHYSEMCTGCHLAPGMADGEMRQGLSPMPPNLTLRRARSPAESFWIIKHGIKMSAMPAWGGTHDDKTIWAIVAFLQQLPTLSADDYAALTGPPDAADQDHRFALHGHEHVSSEHDGDAASQPTAGPGVTTIRQPPAVRHSHDHAGGV
jgi:mono/diheme cytochrome c family protein